MDPQAEYSLADDINIGGDEPVFTRILKKYSVYVILLVCVLLLVALFTIQNEYVMDCAVAGGAFALLALIAFSIAA